MKRRRMAEGLKFKKKKKKGCSTDFCRTAAKIQEELLGLAGVNSMH